MNVTIRFFDTLASYGEDATVALHTSMTQVSAASLAEELRERDAKLCDIPFEDCAPYEVMYFQDDGQGVATFVVRTTGLGPRAENNCFFPGLIEYAETV
jgi:hypothetical protein